MRQDDVGNDAQVIPEKIKNYIKDNFKTGRVVCLTGAGISADSGIPTFRGKAGLWERYDPQDFANTAGLISVLRTNPEELVNFIVDFYSVLLKALPNPAHRALTTMEKENILTSTITQNIDGLHRQAGSQNVIELHGNAFRRRCMQCSKSVEFGKDKLREMIELLQIDKGSYIKILKVLSRYFPRCATCGCRYRIDIVLFGEELPQDALSRAREQLDNCKVLLLIGSSLLVYPAAGLPLYAKERGAKIIEINNGPSALPGLCDYIITGRASEVLPEILGVLRICVDIA